MTIKAGGKTFKTKTTLENYCKFVLNKAEIGSYLEGEWELVVTHERFYNWCVDRHKEGHNVFISEYWMPEDRFKCVWEKQVNSSLTKETGSKKAVEKLFVPI